MGKSISHEEFIVEELKADSEFFDEYLKETMQEEDEVLFKIAMRHIIKAKGFHFDLVETERQKEAA